MKRKTIRLTVKEVKELGIREELSKCPSSGQGGSVIGMRNKFYGDDTLVVVSTYIYNVEGSTYIKKKLGIRS